MTSDPHTSWQKAVECLKDKQWHEAIACLETVLQHDENHFLAWYNLAVAHHKLGNLAQCKKALERVKRLVQDPEHHQWREKVTFLDQEIQKAEETIKKMRQSRSLDDSSVEDQLRVGRLFETRGFLDPALSIYQKIVEKHPDSLEAWQAFIRLSVRLQRNDLFFIQLNKLLERQHSRQHVLRILLTHVNHVGRMEDINQLLTMLSQKEENVDLLIDLARTCLHQRKNELVITMLDHVLHQKSSLPREREIRLMLAIALRRCGAYREALHHLKHVLALDTNDAGVFYQLGLCYQLLGDVERAILHYRKCLKVKPDFAEAWNNLAVVSWKKGLVGEARECFDKIIAMGLDTEQTWFNRALFLLEQGQLNESIKCLEKTLEKNPSHQKARELLNRLRSETSDDHA